VARVYNFRKARLLKFGRAKTFKFRLDFWQLSTLIANISGTGRHRPIEHPKSSWSTTAPPKKTWRTLVHLRKSYRGAYWATQVDIFLDTVCRPLKGAASSNCTRARHWPRLPSAHPNWDGGPPKKKCNREYLKFGLKLSVWASITSMLLGISSPNFYRRRDELWLVHKQKKL